MIKRLVVVGLALLFALGGAHAAEQRIALVIGNSAYKASPLANPANDANDIGIKLRSLGFDVTVRTNTSLKEMTRAITVFGERLKEGSVALFYYAGHGIQARGRNFLIPVDAEIQSEAAVRSEAVDVDQLLEQLAPARVSMVILDACRNNPFERRFRSAGGGGLAQIDAPKGTLIAYATAPGKVAADGTGRNGLYTQELLRAMDRPNLKIEDVFKQVRINVSTVSKDQQIPWESSSLMGDFFFRSATDAQTASARPAASAPAVRIQSADEIEQELWNGVRNGGDKRDLEGYLAQYPSGRFVALARQQLRNLAVSGAPAPERPAATATGRASGNPRVELKTSQGALVIELYQDKAPKSVENFLQYAKDGFFNGTVFHRVIPDFMIQGGGFTPDMKQKATRSPIQNEAANGLKNELGTLAMARTGDPHSASAQFFINLKDNSFLDYPGRDGWGYAVFGKVVQGFDIVQNIGKLPTGKAGPHQNVPSTPVLIESVTLLPAKK